jgi:hypothetical protein
MDLHKQVVIDYTASNGRRYVRTIEPVEGQLTFNYTDRKDSLPEWAIVALDISGDGTLKTFKLARIHSWKPIEKKP